jgi:AcrR family transcriptional regulator
VTKPIAYQHFGTREGLLCALYQRLGHRHEVAAADALVNQRAGQATPTAVADIVARAFIDCIVENGDEYAAIIAALLASPDGAAASRALRQSMVAAYARVLATPFSIAGRTPALLADALIGAGERLGDAVRSGDASRDQAVSLLTTMLAALLSEAVER